jgi:hypothetical protein
MSDALETLKTILNEKLSDDEAQAFAAELTRASGEGSVAISGDATGAVTLTGSQNIAGNNNQFVINQGIDVVELVKILLSVLRDGFIIDPIRLLIQELNLLQPPHLNRSPDADQEGSSFAGDLPFRKLVLDLTTLKEINAKLEIIEEIYRAGYLPTTQQPELIKLKQRLQAFNNLNQELQNITEQGDRLVQEAVAAMRLQLDFLKLAGADLTGDAHASVSELECQQAEAEIFKIFAHRLEDSRLGAEWIAKNMDMLINHASKAMLKEVSDLNASESRINDFKFSLKQFLEQVNFSLYWGTYEMLDSPEIPLVVGTDQYKIAFQSMKETVSLRLRSETIQSIEECLDYLIERLRFYE